MSQSINYSQFSPFNLVSEQILSDLALHTELISVSKGSMLFKRFKELKHSFYLVRGTLDLIDNNYQKETIESGSERARHPLNTDEAPNVSAVATSDVVYFMVKNSAIDRMVTSSNTDSDTETLPAVDESFDWMSELLECPVFTRIPSLQLQNVFNKFEKVYAHEGEVIVREGEMGDYFYVLSAGQAQITNNSGDLNVTISAGSYFGEEALVSCSPRNATVRMKQNGVLQRLSAEDFTTLVKKPVLKYIDPESLSSIENDYQIIDVRLPIEYRLAHFPGSINMPLSRLRKSLETLRQESTYLISDDAGARTDLATYLMCQAGLDACILKGAGPDNRLSKMAMG